MTHDKRFVVIKMRRCKGDNEELYPNLRPFCERYEFDRLPEKIENSLMEEHVASSSMLEDVQHELESLFHDDFCACVFKIYDREIHDYIFHTRSVI